MRKLIILSVVVFILAVLFKTPARVISAQLPKNSPVSLQGVSGSLWEGKAAQINVDGVNLGEVNWTVNPLGLLTGAAKGDFHIQGQELKADGNYQISLGKVLTVDKATFSTTGRFVNKLQRYARLDGDFRGSIDHLEMEINEVLAPPVVSGLINWEQGSVSSPIKLAEGNYQIKVEPESEGRLVAKITANDAPVDIKGDVVLDSQWQYETNLKIKTKQRGASIQGMLSMAGRPQPDGYIHVKEKGRLF